MQWLKKLVLKAAWHMQAGFGLLVVEGVHLPEGASLAPLPEKRRKVACIIFVSQCTTDNNECRMNAAFFRIMRAPNLFYPDISRHFAGHRIYRGLGLRGDGFGWPVQVHEYGVYSPQNGLLLGSGRLLRQVRIFDSQSRKLQKATVKVSINLQEKIALDPP